MKVILLKDVARMGRRFDVKEVPSGHALNFLIPKKLAEIATPENLKRIENHKQSNAESVLDAEHAFDSALQTLISDPVIIPAPTNAQGHLFKGIKAEDISKKLELHDIHIDASCIMLDEPIKSIGEYTVVIKMGKKQGACTVKVIST